MFIEFQANETPKPGPKEGVEGTDDKSVNSIECLNRRFGGLIRGVEVRGEKFR